MATKRRFTAWGFAVGLAFACSVASAQQLPAPEAPLLKPPRLKVDSGAAYPERAIREHFGGSVTVVLVLEVDPEGHVRNASVAEPRGHGFDEAAVAAARGLVFEPATRDGRPVAARIKFNYAFVIPAPRLVGRVARLASDAPIVGARVTVRDATGALYTTITESDGSWGIPGLAPGLLHISATASGRVPRETDETLVAGEETSVVLRLASEASAALAGADGGTEPEQVTVKGQRPPREVTRRTLGREEIAHSAGTHGDALLSLQNLPGVARPPLFSGALIVRGSAPDDTNIFIDGTNVPLVYHFGGLSSVVPTELLERIDFYPGNYGAPYGRGMGGVVDVGLRDPKKDGYHGLGQLELAGARLLVEGPIAWGWSFLAAGQRSWIDLVVPPLLKATHAPAAALPQYGDYQIELQKNFGARSSFRLLFLGSDDAFKLVDPIANASDPTFGADFSYHTSFWRLQARFDSKLSEQTRLRLLTAYGQDSVTLSLGSLLVDASGHPLSGRAEISERLSAAVVANAGLDLVYEPVDVTLHLPPLTRPGIPSGGPGQLRIDSRSSSTLFQPAVYTDLELVPWRGARIVPGLRADYDSATKQWDFAPRINARQALADRFPRTTIKGGLGLYDQPPSPFDTIPRFGQTGLRSNRSVQSDVGVEQEFTRQLDLSVDVFYKWMDRLVVAGAGNSGRGFAYGVEWLLRYKPDERFFGWVSYTLSRSERSDVPGEPYRLFQYDQTHVLTLIGSYKLGRGWQVGARFRLTSGDLYTPTSTGAYDATVGSQLGVSAFPPNGSRLPLFEQLDLRVDKVWTFNFRLNWYLDLQNAYDAQNPIGVVYNYNYTKSAPVAGLPIPLPIVGVRGDL